MVSGQGEVVRRDGGAGVAPGVVGVVSRLRVEQRQRDDVLVSPGQPRVVEPGQVGLGRHEERRRGGPRRLTTQTHDRLYAEGPLGPNRPL